mmetsp:Transcript_65073/g.172353  ORF Transcript_65073/g.172353 Transcript_65073/m.172353 type:complete len:500 (-) Transcript_65073:965-2464(-)
MQQFWWLAVVRNHNRFRCFVRPSLPTPCNEMKAHPRHQVRVVAISHAARLLTPIGREPNAKRVSQARSLGKSLCQWGVLKRPVQLVAAPTRNGNRKRGLDPHATRAREGQILGGGFPDEHGARHRAVVVMPRGAQLHDNGPASGFAAKCLAQGAVAAPIVPRVAICPDTDHRRQRGVGSSKAVGSPHRCGQTCCTNITTACTGECRSLRGCEHGLVRDGRSSADLRKFGGRLDEPLPVHQSLVVHYSPGHEGQRFHRHLVAPTCEVVAVEVQADRFFCRPARFNHQLTDQLDGVLLLVVDEAIVVGKDVVQWEVGGESASSSIHAAGNDHRKPHFQGENHVLRHVVAQPIKSSEVEYVVWPCHDQSVNALLNHRSLGTGPPLLILIEWEDGAEQRIGVAAALASQRLESGKMINGGHGWRWLVRVQDLSEGGECVVDIGIRRTFSAKHEHDGVTVQTQLCTGGRIFLHSQQRGEAGCRTLPTLNGRHAFDSRLQKLHEW